jgi:arylsulfatase A-like enzyme
MIVILYVLDSLRADFLSCYGFDKKTSPNIDALAKDGVLFRNAYATSTWTKPSAASILTGLYPRTLGVMNDLSVLPNSEYSLQNVLKKNGFKCYGISANAFFSPDFGFSGFDEFFTLQKDEELLKSRTEAKRPSKAELKILEKLGIDKIIIPLSEDINEKIFPILDSNVDNNIFIMAWSVDTHGPYFVRGNKSYFGNSLDDFILEKDARKYPPQKLKNLYYDMVYYNDLHIGKLISKLKEKGVYEESLIIITADHGEAFGEHKSIFGKPILGHAGIPYEEKIKIPLIIKFPGNEYAGMVVEELVDLTDIYPTIMKVLRIKSDFTKIQGRPLYPPTQISNGKIIFVESQLNKDSDYAACLRKENYKYIKIDFCGQKGWKQNLIHYIKSVLVDRHQLYDLSKDPLEKLNLAKSKPQKFEEFKKLYYEIVEQCNQLSLNYQKEEKSSIDEDIKERLRVLGYFQ